LLDLIDRKGNSPLHWACLRNYTGIARMLISKKADFRMENHIGRTPKQYALQKYAMLHETIVKIRPC
jgi:ankyrin repeat protein